MPIFVWIRWHPLTESSCLIILRTPFDWVTQDLFWKDSCCLGVAVGRNYLNQVTGRVETTGVCILPKNWRLAQLTGGQNFILRLLAAPDWGWIK